MKCIQIIFILATLCTISQTYKYNYCEAPLPLNRGAPGSDSKLVTMAVITRHGDRSPANVLPYEDDTWDFCNIESLTVVDDHGYNIHVEIPGTDQSHYSENLWKGNCVPGQLTEKGYSQHLDLGKELRKIYVDQYKFLPKEYDVNQIYVRSTNVWRTKQSAQAQMLGLYPDKISQIPLHIRPREVDNLSVNSFSCPKVNNLTAECMNSKEFVETQKNTLDLYRKFNKITGISPDNVAWNREWDHYFDNFNARKCHGIEYPSKNDHYIREKDVYIMSLTASKQTTMLFGGEIARLSTADFVEELLTSFNATMFSESSIKYRLFSGHDNTISILLNAFNVHDGLWPPYASHIIIELWEEIPSQYSVRFIYNGDVKVIPGCEAMCSWEKFYSYSLENIFFKDYAEECYDP
eukprot:TRINITY_DN12089_c0_g1_i1.p1 TRINITY_DN12089_c0_g1~~TRINITY_DN12089_c0_g1_i1.p1  ORF type:complete len:407 (-),score=71.87 TRINITY_DN12089_c0_g1_i1:57-1277(-)